MYQFPLFTLMNSFIEAFLLFFPFFPFSLLGWYGISACRIDYSFPVALDNLSPYLKFITASQNLIASSYYRIVKYWSILKNSAGVWDNLENSDVYLLSVSPFENLIKMSILYRKLSYCGPAAHWFHSSQVKILPPLQMLREDTCNWWVFHRIQK